MSTAGYIRAVVRGMASVSTVLPRGGPEVDFDTFGRLTGLRLALRARREAVRLIVNPVSLTRYWEFPFVAAHLPPSAQRCLDVGSPRLLSMWAVHTRRVGRVLMINPDERDASTTRAMCRAIAMRGVDVLCESIERHLPADEYDCIWSVSVVEHIAGESADSNAVRRMMSMLRPGGRLILTLPVDRSFRIETRGDDVYKLSEGAAETYFFQRVYDQEALNSRIISAAGVAPVAVGWFGERVAGAFDSYVARWKTFGLAETASDPLIVRRDYRSYETWEEMPGHGVVGLVFERPRGVG